MRAGETPTVKTAKNSALPRLVNLLATLRAAQQSHWTAHWQSQGPSAYSDHILFQHLYEGVTPHIDGLAEKIVVIGGAEAVDLTEQMSTVTKITSAWREKDPIARAMQAEKAVLTAIENTMEMLVAVAEGSAGLTSLIGEVADEHETFVYLLTQRAAGGAPLRGERSRRKTAGTYFDSSVLGLTPDEIEEAGEEGRKEYLEEVVMSVVDKLDATLVAFRRELSPSNKKKLQQAQKDVKGVVRRTASLAQRVASRYMRQA